MELPEHQSTPPKYKGYQCTDWEEWHALSSYKAGDFPRTDVTVDCVVLWKPTFAPAERTNHNWDVLLVQRKAFPYKHHWALPGGYVNQDETTYDAAVRELFEETAVTWPRPSSVDWDQSLQLTVSDAPNRDPRGRVISIPYLFAMTSFTRPGTKAGDDASNVKWYGASELLVQRDGLAFDHGHTLTEAIAQADRLYGH